MAKKQTRSCHRRERWFCCIRMSTGGYVPLALGRCYAEACLRFGAQLEVLFESNPGDILKAWAASCIMRVSKAEYQTVRASLQQRVDGGDCDHDRYVAGIGLGLDIATEERISEQPQRALRLLDRQASHLRKSAVERRRMTFIEQQNNRQG